ncbi:hypothetical protein DAPPUDRAFT_102532 [Daphnia pulex]|uniref:Uncharacterized protein n=1 Tax=Daphnia pulex TaxID=6669 RepID=E9GGN0_DAPPU|nr:hypothetical protein DAPPUDRAFT_102532 [Daphnia pulex]|eukprot:EFX81459.1 hypothetical protein DAPPUDRAFT_102532 [Daphnia pulex]
MHSLHGKTVSNETTLLAADLRNAILDNMTRYGVRPAVSAYLHAENIGNCQRVNLPPKGRNNKKGDHEPTPLQTSRKFEQNKQAAVIVCQFPECRNICDNQKSSETGQQHRIHRERKTTDILSPEQKFACDNYGNHYISFNRMLVRNCVYTVSTYKKDAKRRNCFVMDSEGRVIKIMSFGILQSCNENQRNVPIESLEL